MSDYRSVDDDNEVTTGTPAPEPIAEDRGEVQAKAPPSKGNQRKWIALGIFLVGLLIIIGFAIFMFSKIMGQNAPNQEPDPSLEPEVQEGPSLGGYQEQLNAAQMRAEQARRDREREAEARRLQEERAQQVADRALESASSGQSPPPISSPSTNRQSQRGGEVDPNSPSVRRLGGNVVIGGSSSSGDLGGAANGAAGLMGGEAPNNQISSMLEGETFEPGSASIMQNMDMLLRRGTVIPCVLQNRIVSTYPGLSSCVITQDVYSADGSTVLAERGSVAYGEQKVALTHGQARLFMTWNEIDTAGGVRVRIDSLATDNLGASGVDAYIDNHFWDRFGGAIMLSFIDDALEVVANELSDQRQQIGTSFSSSTNNVQNMAEIALEQSINIPPTGYVNQGQLLNIRVARDVDFSSVYEVRGR